MSHPVPTTLIRTTQLTLVLLAIGAAYLLLEIFEYSGDAMFVLVCGASAFVGLVSLLFVARDLGREAFGDATAWAFLSLPLLLFLTVLSVHYVNSGSANSACDSLVGCTSLPAIPALPLFLFTPATVLNVAIVRGAKARS